MLRVVQVGPDLDVKGGVSQVIRLILDSPPDTVTVSHLPTLPQKLAVSHYPRWRPEYYMKSFGIVAHLLRTIRGLDALCSSTDLFHIHVSVYGSTLRKYLISKRLHRQEAPFLLHNHGADYHIFYAHLPPLLKSKVHQMFLWAKGTIALSERWRIFHQQLVAIPTYPIWVLPNPVNLPRETCDQCSPALRVLYLGRFDARKGGARVIRALATLPDSVRSRVFLHMAGDGEVNATRKLAHELGLGAQVEVRDWIGGEEKQCWFRVTNSFILPSREEGLPMAMLEAMAWGKALIVSPVGGIPEFVTDGVEGFLVPPDDIDAIADAIRKLAENPDLRVQMGTAARKRVEPLDIQNYRVRLGEIYREALS